MLIDNLIKNPGPDEYYSPDFQAALEAFLVTFRADPSLTVMDVPPIYGVKYKGDFYGLLLALQLEPEFHWFTLRLNDFWSPLDFDETTTSILIPNRQKLGQIKMMWSSSQVIAT